MSLYDPYPSYGGDKYVIGRRPDCHIVLPYPGISRAHACLITGLGGFEDDSFILIDMGSTQGTWVFRGGRWMPVENEAVSTTDRIRLGPFETTVAELLLQLQARPVSQEAPRQRLFISYRRADTGQLSGRIFDYLAERYGADNVFFDTQAIPGGVDFRTRIRSAMNESFAALAVIGNDWNRHSRWQAVLARLGRQPEVDHVVVEIETAIAARVPVLPLLDGETMMPKAKDLPHSIRPIANLNALRVRSGRDFKNDMEQVESTLARFKAT